MPSTIYALVDCNNFYVSCERVFNPKLRNRPVVVLSNNDGCTISRSNEAKSIGIAMGEPLFKIRDLIKKHNIAVLSSNFALYGELSARVMHIIQQMMPEVEIYSIDEAFINLSTMQNFNLSQTCLDLSVKIEQYTGIPVSIGIGPSKTLAKVANLLAKRQKCRHSVFYLDSAIKINSILPDILTREVWGIGRKLEKKLQAIGVYTAQDLIQLPENIIKSSFNIVMQKTILELQGVSCIKLQDNLANKQQIMVSRSFGQRVTELAPLQEAISCYASNACEKLRKQKSATHGFSVFLHTGLHGESSTVYYNSIFIKLAAPSFDSRLIINQAKAALQKIYRPGYRYQKVGIVLCDLYNIDKLQLDVFANNNLAQEEKLMSIIDEINHKLGRSTIQLAAAGLDKSWRMQRTHKSPGYLTSWNELPIARC